MAAYNKCLQITFILVQLALIALGAILIGVGVWLELEERDFVAAIESRTFLYGPYLIVAAGCAIIVVAAIGMVGALCDHKINRFLLYLYIVLVLVVFAAQLVGGILAFVYRDQLPTVVSEGLTSTLGRYGGSSTSDTAVTKSWDFVQTTADCCGINNVSDWLNANITFDGGVNFPASCCVTTVPDCNNGTISTGDIRPNGCQSAVINFLSDQLVVVAAIGIAFIIGEIVVVLIAFCLVCCTEFED